VKKNKQDSITEHVRRKYHRPGNGVLKTEAEIATALGEEVRTIRHWRHSGIIPWVFLGHRTVRLKLEDVLDALRKRTIKGV
jgi:excisionase family DNA binding protein